MEGLALPETEGFPFAQPFLPKDACGCPRSYYP